MSQAVVIGAGPGLSASVARKLAARGHDVTLVARDPSDLAGLAGEIGARTVTANAREPDDMAGLFESFNDLAVAVYNPSARTRAAIDELTPQQAENALMVSAFGAYLMAHHAVPLMKARGSGALLFTGASAGIKGFPNSAAFAMGKFALRGLCQSLARELHPQNIHVGHFVIDGGIDGTPQRDRSNVQGGPDNMLDPDAIAETYMALLDQHRSAWTWEMEVRPWVETF